MTSSSDRPARGSGDDLRGSFTLLRGGLDGPTFVLCLFVYATPAWVAVARSAHRAKLDALADLLAPLVMQPFQVIEVACDPDNVEAVEAAVAKLALVDDEMVDHFHHPLRNP